MGERLENIEEIPLPGGLDIIKIDGRWAQVYSADLSSFLVQFLDDGTEKIMDVAQKYKFVKYFKKIVGDLLESGDLPKEEFKRVRWDSENIGKGMAYAVRVFGEYEPRNKDKN